MGDNIVLAETPSEQEIEARCAELEALEAELAQRELELATLKGELIAFERRYLRVVGIRQAQLDEIEAHLKEFLVQLSPQDRQVKEDAQQARAQAQQTTEIFDRLDHLSLNDDSFQPSADLKQRYREIAKIIHPDLATDEEERAWRTQLMAEANLAYQHGDEERLKAIFEQWQQHPNQFNIEEPGTRLARITLRINQITRRITAITAEIARLKDSDVYHLKLQVEQAEGQGIDLLKAMAEHLDRQIVACLQRLEELQDRYEATMVPGEG